MKVLITGASGFIGKNLHQYLKEMKDIEIITFDKNDDFNLVEKNIVFNKLIKNIEPLGFFDYVRLQKDSYCVLSDSGTISEESSILNFPSVSIRTSTERPEALDAGSIVLGGIDKNNIINAIEIATGSHDETRLNPVNDYQDINVSGKVVKIIQSYTNIVNIRTWRKK